MVADGMPMLQRSSCLFAFAAVEVPRRSPIIAWQARRGYFALGTGGFGSLTNNPAAIARARYSAMHT
jgi:hypothetical protein